MRVFKKIEWKLPRVVEAYSSADGIVWELKLLLSDTTLVKGKPQSRSVYLKRPVHKVITSIEANWVRHMTQLHFDFISIFVYRKSHNSNKRDFGGNVSAVIQQFAYLFAYLYLII